MIKYITVLFMLFISMATAELTITINRTSETSGTLSCPKAGVNGQQCWWKKGKKIPAGTYTGCSATIMNTKKHNAIFIPNVTGYSEIFIHPGNKPEDSDGCIVMPKSQVDKIWKKAGKDKKNVTVIIKDN